MNKELLIMLPAYNEEESIALVLNRMLEAGIHEIGDILVINDGSSDNTEKIVRNFNVNILNLVNNMGYGSALQVGYKYAEKKGYEYVIQLDADGQHDICNIKIIYDCLKNKDYRFIEAPDIVIGSRFLSNSVTFNISKIKHFAISFFRIVIKIFTQNNITDPTSGLQGLNRRVFTYYAGYGNFDYRYPDINMIIQMIMLGYNIKEIPAIMHERKSGEGMHSGIIKPIKYMILISLSTLSIILRNRKNLMLLERESLMNNKDKDYKVKNENYFGLVIIIGLVFILLMTIINVNYYIKKSKDNSGMEIKNNIQMLKDENENKPALNPSCIIVSGKDKNGSNVIVKESLEKARITYTSKEVFDDITDNELQSAEIIINGSEYGSLGNEDMLFEYLKEGKHIIFTSMPDIDYIKTSLLEDIMGIKNITQPELLEGIEFLPGFMIGGLLELPKLSYTASKVELLSTTKTYVINSVDSVDSPVIWRNIYGESEIYMVNGPFIESNAGYGILSAIMAQIYPNYIYPIVNAKVFTYTGLPYVSAENIIQIQEIYTRNTMQLQHDILIPDILSINKSRNLIPNGFITDSFNKDNRYEINEYNLKQINNYEKDIYKLGGEVGMVYSGNLQKDIEIYQGIFANKNLNSILINGEDFEYINELMYKEQFSSIESVLGPWINGGENFGYITENTVYIPFTIDGINNTDLDILEFYSSITAFGAIVQNLSMEQVIFPVEDKDNWMYLSREYIKFIDSYREKFQMLESRNITETALSVKKFEINSPDIEYFNNKIIIRFEEWYGESYFILRTNKEVDNINDGIIEKIEDGVYLVTAKNKEVDINLKQIDRYK